MLLYLVYYFAVLINSIIAVPPPSTRERQPSPFRSFNETITITNKTPVSIGSLSGGKLTVPFKQSFDKRFKMPNPSLQLNEEIFEYPERVSTAKQDGAKWMEAYLKLSVKVSGSGSSKLALRTAFQRVLERIAKEASQTAIERTVEPGQKKLILHDAPTVLSASLKENPRKWKDTATAFAPQRTGAPGPHPTGSPQAAENATLTVTILSSPYGTQ